VVKIIHLAGGIKDYKMMKPPTKRCTKNPLNKYSLAFCIFFIHHLFSIQETAAIFVKVV
jgi:hypothetical protein